MEPIPANAVYNCRMRTRCAVAVALLIVAVSCEGSQNAASGPGSGAGFSCPVTAGVAPTTADPCFSGMLGTAFGRGPVFAIVSGASAEIVPFPTRLPAGVFANKVAWVSRPSYVGSVEVTGRRLDAPGKALFGPVVPPELTGLSWSFPAINGNFEPSAAGILAAGCYQWNVVGTGFAHRIVFRATMGSVSA